MPLAGNNRDARARAHYKWAERYAGTGEPGRARAHFGRALEYTAFGGTDELPLQGKPVNRRTVNDVRSIVAAGLVGDADDVKLEYEKWPDDKTVLMRFQRKADGARILARLPAEYPFKAPGVYVDGRRAPEDWRGPADTIIKVLERYTERSAKKTVLILCHPKLVTSINDDAYGHWLGKLPANDGKEETMYDRIMSIHAPALTSDQPVSFFTVDNQPNSNNEADYKADAFASSFVKDHAGEYDAILVPDCGGSWFEVAYNSQGSAESVESLADQCVMMTHMLKPGGLIVLTKISESFKQLLKSKLEKARHSGVIDYKMSGLGIVLVSTGPGPIPE